MAGYVSHGCVDSDLQLQSQNAIQDAIPRLLVYGAGSPFMDLRLPCGGTVEVLIDPNPASNICEAALNLLKSRKVVTLRFTVEHGLESAEDHDAITGWNGEQFSTILPPRLQLFIAGGGPPLIATALMARTMSLPITLLSPDQKFADFALGSGVVSFRHLTSSHGVVEMPLDKWSAVLLLFHDHDWEPAILMTALDSPAFYIGALGSAKTHAQRLLNLEGRGVLQADLARINGPIGVIPAARDAHTLALSALAEIVDKYRQSLVKQH